MNPETIAENPLTELDEAKRKAERQTQLSLLYSRIERELRNAAYKKLEGSRVEQIILQDRRGNAFVYTLTLEEARGVEQALWSAGESMYLEKFREHVAAQALERGLDLSDGAECSITVKRSASLRSPDASEPKARDRHAA